MYEPQFQRRDKGNNCADPDADVHRAGMRKPQHPRRHHQPEANQELGPFLPIRECDDGCDLRGDFGGHRPKSDVAWNRRSTEAVKPEGAVWLEACLLRSLQAVRRCEGVRERLSFAIDCCMAGGVEVFDMAWLSAADTTPIPDVSAAVATMAMR
jgi:hypothetical protein